MNNPLLPTSLSLSSSPVRTSMDGLLLLDIDDDDGSVASSVVVVVVVVVKAALFCSSPSTAFIKSDESALLHPLDEDITLLCAHSLPLFPTKTTICELFIDFIKVSYLISTFLSLFSFISKHYYDRQNSCNVT